jgi:LacI family transcriptional regulator
MHKKCTIKDVALRAGVSVNTVSRALNNKPDVSPKTRENVIQAASELNYKPNRFARGLRSVNSRTIGVIVGDVSNPFFGTLMKSIQKTALKNGYSTIFCNTDEEHLEEQKAIEIMVYEKVDGVLITPTQQNANFMEYLEENGIDFVLIARHFDEIPTSYVIADDIKGGFLATKHLIEQGCRRILHVQGPTCISSSKERLRGCKKAFDYFGIPFDAELVTEPALTMEDGYRVTEEAISRGVNFDGVFAFSDYVALGALKALRKVDTIMPDDVAVVGYDDIGFSSYLNEPLTTVRMPMEEMGRVAFKLLCRMIRGEVEDDEMRVILDVDLIVRATSLRNAK